MLNRIVIMGRLTKEPDLRTTSSGVTVTSFTVAVDRDFGAKKETDFIDCVAWRQTGEFISKYFHKGSMIAVTGRLQSRKWQTREGENRTSWEISVDNAYFGESRKAESADSYRPRKPAESSAGSASIPEDHWGRFREFDDELPF